MNNTEGLNKDQWLGIRPARITVKSNEPDAGGKEKRRKSVKTLPVFDDETTKKKVKLFTETENKNKKQVSEAERKMVI